MNSSPLQSVPAPAPQPSAVAAPPAPAADLSPWTIVLPAGLVLVLAVVLASVPAFASEVWRHLATGRALLQGSYVPGTDPFAYTTEGTTWVNHAWLYDAILYGVYQLAGDYLVVFSAALTALLAALMLAAARPQNHPWTAAIAVALALVALGPYLTLAPTVVAYVLFAFLLWWLDRIEARTPADRPLWTVAPLLVATLLWANCDEWFLLGPIVIALFAVCSPSTPQPTRRLLLAACAGSLVVCLLNPHHVRVFMLPSALQDLPVTGQVAVSPLQGLSHLTLATVPIPLAAYGVLLALCLFALLVSDAARRSWPHIAVVAALAALSLYRTSAIPFFAIAAGPFLGRGWRGDVVRPLSRRMRMLGALAGTLALAGLTVLAAPGWLQGTNQPRGWFVHTDASLRELARTIATWREGGQLGPQARGFNFSVEAAHYLEWFCPGEKVFIDGRPNLYRPDVIAAFRETRQALAAEPAPAVQPPDAAARYRPVLAQWRVTHLLMSDPAERTLVVALRQLWQAPAEWAMVGLAGRATVFAWQTPPAGTPPLALAPVDLARRAFDPATASRAPLQPPAAAPEPAPWWHCFVWSDPAGALDRDEAFLYVAHFDGMQPTYARENFLHWQTKLAVAALAPTGPAQGAGVTALADVFPVSLLATSRGELPGNPPSLVQAVRMAMTAEQYRVDDGPPGSLLLAVRAARRAIAADPNDAMAYLRLGHAYERMLTRTVERAAAFDFALLNELRRVEAIAALTTALRLRPDLLPAHQLLVGLYERANALDLALVHLQRLVHLTRLAGPRPGEAPADFTVRMDALTAQEQALGREVRERVDLVATKAFGLKPYGHARLADSYGLPGHALEVLQRSNYAEFGVEGAIIEIHLLLHAGHAEEARSWLAPEQESKMGRFNYRWLQALAAAAAGDYETAGKALDGLRSDAVDLPDFELQRVPPRTAVALVLGQELLRAASREWFTRRDALKTVLDRATELAQLPRQQAEDRVMRGLLALETGAIGSAESALRASLATWNGDAGPAPIARHYLWLIGRR